MSSLVSTSTSSSLINRVRERDAAAWSRLAKIYAPLVYRWARQCDLQSSDAADVVQEVFLSVASGIDGFSYRDPESSFRAWLWTIARNKIRLFYRNKKGSPEAIGGSDAHRMWHEYPDALLQDEEPSGHDARGGLVHRALQVIRQDFQQQTWQAFLRLAVNGQTASEIAEDLGMTPAAVRQAKYRVLCRLHQELEGC
jgi:RNA polymerase sigma-70 factor (ECF subfamily)